MWVLMLNLRLYFVKRLDGMYVRKAFIIKSQMSSVNVYSFVKGDECVFCTLYLSHNIYAQVMYIIHIFTNVLLDFRYLAVSNVSKTFAFYLYIYKAF